MNFSLMGFLFCIVGYGLMAASYHYFVGKNPIYTLLCNISFFLFVAGMLCFGAMYLN